MNARRNYSGIAAVLILLLVIAGIRLSAPTLLTQLQVAAEAPQAPPAIPQAAPQASLPAALVSVDENISGATVEQTFTLGAGWNAVYLGVEPVNPSAIGPNGVPEKSTMEAVFAGLAASGALESVWAYNQPVSHKDYMIDPSEGLWDAPGWERFVPVQKVGDDGQSQGFLTNLYALHANTGYLVKLKDDLSGTCNPCQFSVSGKPVPGHLRWALAAYNLAGFPLLPGAGATVGSIKAASPIGEIRALTSQGTWTILGDQVALQHGQSYLVYYADPGADGSQNFAAPLDLQQVPSDGITFLAGLQGRRQTFQIENLLASPVTVDLSLAGGSLTIERVENPGGDETTAALAEPITLEPKGAQLIVLQVTSADLTAPAEDLLQISTDSSRWLVPVSAKPGSYDGLWVGEVVVNEVSEARLGRTNGTADVTIGLAQQNASQVSGSAQLHENTVQGITSVAVTVSLALPTVTPAVVRPIEGSGRYVGGYVFLDENQNGQRDADEPGLSGVTVSLGGTGQQTAADGSYVFPGLADGGTYDISAGVPAGYTSSFDVALPDGTVAQNSIPTGVTMGSNGISIVAPQAYLTQVLPAGETLPYYHDATGTLVQAPLNFGYAVAHTVRISSGTCAAPGSEMAAYTAANGQLATDLADKAMVDLIGKANVSAERLGRVVACGDVAVGAPTKFENGQGSEFRFRLILRVQDGLPQLLPHYAYTQTAGGLAFPRVTSPALSIGCALPGSSTFAAGKAMQFGIDVKPNDPLNPFLHKYHPDHDNLDAKFEPFDPSQISAYNWESFDVNRTITLELTDQPTFAGASADLQKLSDQVDWGGMNWGGNYTEVLENLHQNDITVKGYFVLRHMLAGDKLIAQDYDVCAAQ